MATKTVTCLDEVEPELHISIWRDEWFEYVGTADDLKAEFYRHTAAGSREWERSFKRYYATVTDDKFQAFKAKIPGLIPPKRGRKPKAAHQPAPAQ